MRGLFIKVFIVITILHTQLIHVQGTGECSAVPCQNGGTCTYDVDWYTCTCVTGYEGTNCETNTDDCSAGICQNGGTCVDGVNEYTCTCVTGYEGPNCETNTDDCSAGICQNGGTCVDGVNEYTCTCVTGYEGTNCETNTDDCSAGICQNGGTCSDGVNEYTCICVTGYEGTNCETNTDDCSAGICQNGGTCVDGVNEYTCTCVTGYEGPNCETNTDDCSAGICQNAGTCVDGVNEYTCTCVTAYEGTNCETNTDDCSAGICQNGGTCSDGVNEYTCICVTGYEGTNCETNTDDCSAGICQNGGTCVDGVNEYTCTCVTGYEGTNCETNTDDCSAVICLNGGTCSDGVNEYTCTCVTGYEGTNCETNTDDCSADICLNGVTCTDGVNEYTCTCVTGYEGTNCEINTDDCSAGICQNGGTCTDGVNEYTCTCVTGYEGTNCETTLGKVSNLKIIEALGGIYTLMKITWQAPQTLEQNGVIKDYSFVHSTEGKSATTQILTHEPLDDYEYSVVVNVIPEETYTFQVYASNEQGVKGEISTVVVEAPAGVPVNVEDTLQVNVISSHKTVDKTPRMFTVTIAREFFEESTNGRIQATGLLACVKDCDFSSIKNISDFNTTSNWQQASQNGFPVYRVTYPTWLLDLQSQSCSCERKKRAVSSLEYTLGSDDCRNISPNEYCNGPLSSGTEFLLVAVACTNGGCLLSKMYGPFSTAPESIATCTEKNCTTQSVIIGVVLGLIIVILFLYAGYTTLVIRRYRASKDGRERHKDRKSDVKGPLYVNESFNVGVVEAAEGPNDPVLNRHSETEYSRLDDNTRDDKATYEIIQAV